MKMRRSTKSREMLSIIAVSIKYHQHDNPVTWIRENGENFEHKTSDTIDRSTGIGNNSDDDGGALDSLWKTLRASMSGSTWVKEDFSWALLSIVNTTRRWPLHEITLGNIFPFVLYRG